MSCCTIFIFVNHTHWNAETNPYYVLHKMVIIKNPESCKEERKERREQKREDRGESREMRKERAER